MTLLEKLKAALKAAKLDEGLADILTVTEEGQIATIVQQLTGIPASTETTVDVSEFLASPRVSEYIKTNGFDALLKLNKSLQSEHDKKVAQGITTFKTKLLEGEQTPDQIAAAAAAAAAGGKGPEDMPSWAGKLFEKITALETQKQTESKASQARAALEGVNIPKNLKEAWSSRINLESETSFEEQAKALEAEYKSIHTGIVGNGTYEFAGEDNGGGGSGGGKLSDADRAALSKAAKNL